MISPWSLAMGGANPRAPRTIKACSMSSNKLGSARLDPRRRWMAAAAAVALLGGRQAHAQAPAPAQPGPAQGAEVSEIVVTAQRLDAARSAVEPALAATSYTLPRAFIDNLPAGANTGLNQVVLQTPGVAQDSFGQLHVRGDHGDIQYRLNNVILPEGLQVFGQTLSPRLAASVQLITGALPAQYGLRTAGIINITTKSGFRNGGEASIYGGSHGLITPSLDYGGSFGRSSAFGSLSYTGTDVGIESPDGSGRPVHDHSDQAQGFGYFDHILDGESRISGIVGTSQQTFEIPDTPGLHPALGLTVQGRSDFPSADLDGRQREATTYAIGTHQRTSGALTSQASLFARYSTLRYSPDFTGELLFDGIAQAARKTDLSVGAQIEAAYDLSAAHTLRAGLVLQHDRTTSDTTSLVLPADAAGLQTSDVPLAIVDDSRSIASTYSAFLQDEWKISHALTVNYGLRYDLVDSFRREQQVSPRVGVVWIPRDGTTLHAGYARYFTPPPFELVAGQTVAKFAGTTAAAPGVGDDLPRSERDDYYDVGVEHAAGRFRLGLDLYDKQAKDLLDEGQFGAPIILTPFNYAQGYARGVEFSANYAHGPLTGYANLAVSEAKGRDIVSSQFNFEPADLAYIRDHDIHLDHDQTVTASAGAAYRAGETRVSADLIYGSGLRRDGDTPNGAKLPSYVQVNLGVSRDLDLDGGITLRADIINLFDDKYEIRDGTGIGVGAPQWGPRRGVFIGVSKML
jgi:outer membrane receptor protein involved in Fe transport